MVKVCIISVCRTIKGGKLINIFFYANKRMNLNKWFIITILPFNSKQIAIFHNNYIVYYPKFSAKRDCDMAHYGKNYVKEKIY